MKQRQPYNDECKAWADLVLLTARQKAVVSKDTNNVKALDLLSRQIGRECGVDAEVAYSWITGYDLPRHVDENNGVLKVLGLQVASEEDFISAAHQGMSKALLMLMRRSLDITHAWQTAYDTIKDVPARKVEAGAIVKGDRSGAAPKEGVRDASGYEHVNYDDAAMPPRRHASLQRYETLSKQELGDIQQQTENFPEFIRVSRLLKGISMGRLSDILRRDYGISVQDTTLSKYEIGDVQKGTMFPEHVYEGMLNVLVGKGSALYERGETLFLNNSVLLLSDAAKRKDISSYKLRRVGLPQPYFDMHNRDFVRIENEAWGPIDTEMIERIASYYETQNGFSQWFDRTLFNRLPYASQSRAPDVQRMPGNHTPSNGVGGR